MSKHPLILRAGALALAGALLALSWTWFPGRPLGQATAGPAQLPDGPFVALTFDDGPRSSTTTALLDGLSRRGVRATFLSSGKTWRAMRTF